ncbi:MAG: RagB/SusD family nutrient uptake outer membrane protein [Bacteroidales bacterium]|nr:RagB/SusD family nutrient uptake outer membrane protein [Bacteroidales bacterium]
MKLYRLFLVALAGAAIAASCTKMEDIAPQSGTMLESQVQKTNEIAPSRAEASFNGMFTNIGKPAKMYSNPDDWEFLMILFCNDLEGADAHIADSGYNWFSVCGELSSRNANYRNPYIRYRAPYNMIADVNTFLAGFSEDVSDPSSINMIAQARCLRAYSYMMLVPNYQFNYQIAKDKPCVPICSPDVEDVTHNPRATVAEIYDIIINDLSYAIDNLGTDRKTKAYINVNVAHGLRARAYLEMGEWQKAYDDAVAAAQGYEPASIAEVSKPAFMNMDEHNWIWGYDMTADIAAKYLYATTSSWLRSFSANGYAPACQVYTCINTILWNKIPATDIRKQWWVDEDLHSTISDELEWPGLGPVATADDGGDTKLPFLPYTNVKFGCDPIGTISNEEDMPLMRVEEMILIQAECQYRLGQSAAAVSTLESFVQGYRDPEYVYDASRFPSFIEEIWFQRRVELWGEGFFIPDQRRLQKPLVRFIDDTNNIAPAYRFNLAADDPWLLLRFPQGEMNTNFDIVDNTGGNQPKTDQGKGIFDGVTD